jgi:hypothetical protein
MASASATFKEITKAIFFLNKRYRIPKGQSKMDNPEKLAT